MSLRHTAHYYHEVLKRLRPQAAPAFEDPAMQARVWGQPWGVANDVGQLRLVLLHLNSTHLPYWLPETLQWLDIRLLEMHYQDSSSVVNCLALWPGTVVLAINNDTGTAKRLEKAGITVIPVDFSESQRNGGGIHCATLPLVRDWNDTERFGRAEEVGGMHA